MVTSLPMAVLVTGIILAFIGMVMWMHDDWWTSKAVMFLGVMFVVSALWISTVIPW